MKDGTAQRLIESLIAFVDRGECDEMLAIAERRLVWLRLRVVAIKLVGWMKSQNRVHRKLPLQMNERYEWCADVRLWLAADARAGAVFVSTSDGIELHPDISEAEKDALYKLVDDKYQSRLRT